MSLHWMHITASYALVLGGFIALAATAALRQAEAKRKLAALETRRRPASDDRSAAVRGGLDRMPVQ